MTRNNQATLAIDFDVEDIYRNKIKLSEFHGRAVMLCFFKEACIGDRKSLIHFLTNNYEQLQDAGVEVVTVFSETVSRLKSTFKKRPRPFAVIADPKLELFDKYELKDVVGSSPVSKRKSISKIGNLFSGKMQWLNSDIEITPAQFLITDEGQVRRSWHGRDDLDYIPMEKIDSFVLASRIATRKREIAKRKAKIYK